MQARTAFSALLLIPALGCTTGNSDQGAVESADQVVSLREPGDFFPAQRAKVLVVGCFHFHYPGLDAHKTAEEDKFDVLRKDKRGEVDELVAYIERFKPTKVALEATEKWDAYSKLKTFTEATLSTQRDERYQLGLRIAFEMGLDTIYSIDAEAFAQDLEVLDSGYAAQLFADYDWRSNDRMDSMYDAWRSYTDEMANKVPLLQYMKYMNSREYHQYDYGAYLVGDFRLGEHRGADVLSVHWYNRNLRIVRKLQDMTESGTDRILLIIGNGHAAVLRQLLECSPDFDFVEFESL